MRICNIHRYQISVPWRRGVLTGKILIYFGLGSKCSRYDGPGLPSYFFHSLPFFPPWFKPFRFFPFVPPLFISIPELLLRCLPYLASVLFWSRLLSPFELLLSSLFTIHFTFVKTEAVGLLSRTVQSPNPVCWRHHTFSDLSQFWGWWDLHLFLTSPVSLSAMVLFK